eukprot:3229135-Rhodomonas_salina.2
MSYSDKVSSEFGSFHRANVNAAIPTVPEASTMLDRSSVPSALENSGSLKVTVSSCSKTSSSKKVIRNPETRPAFAVTKESDVLHRLQAALAWDRTEKIKARARWKGSLLCTVFPLHFSVQHAAASAGSEHDMRQPFNQGDMSRSHHTPNFLRLSLNCTISQPPEVQSVCIVFGLSNI